MKRLFSVGTEHFATKHEAKAARQDGQTVRRGPDHMGKHGNGKPARKVPRCGVPS